MKKEIFTKQQLLQADLEKPALEAMGLTDKELRHKLHKAVKSLKKENKGSEKPTTQEDSSAVLTKILADLEAMGIKKNEVLLIALIPTILYYETYFGCFAVHSEPQGS